MNPKHRRRRNRLDTICFPQRCSSCHAELSTMHSQKTHAKLTSIGYLPAAACFECHGAHDIQPLDAANSRLSAASSRRDLSDVS